MPSNASAIAMPAEAKRLLAALRVEVSQVGGRIEVRTVYPRTTGIATSTAASTTR